MHKNPKLVLSAIDTAIIAIRKEEFKLGYNACLKKIIQLVDSSEAKAISKEAFEQIAKVVVSDGAALEVATSGTAAVQKAGFFKIFGSKTANLLHFNKDRPAYLSVLMGATLTIPASLLALWVNNKSTSKALQGKLDAAKVESDKKDKALLAKDTQIVALEAEAQIKDVRLAAKDKALAEKDMGLDSLSQQVQTMTDQVKAIKEHYKSQVSFLTQTLTSMSLLLLKNISAKSSWFGFFRNNENTRQSGCDIIVEESDEKEQVTIKLLNCN